MTTTVINITKRITAILLIGIVGLLIINKAVFFHSHSQNNGTIVSHSHPFNKSEDAKPLKSHKHTSIEFLLLENLELLIPLVVIGLTYIKKVTARTLNSYYGFKASPVYIVLKNGRAPPSSSM